MDKRGVPGGASAYGGSALTPTLSRREREFSWYRFYCGRKARSSQAAASSTHRQAAAVWPGGKS